MDNNNNTIDNNAKFKKRGNAGLKGIKFQIHLITMFLLKTMETFTQWWQLSSEDDRAGKFDDVILEFPNGAILMQSKHTETKTVTFEDLLSTNSKNEFSLAKHFLSYQKAIVNYQIQNVVIITNTDVIVGENEIFLKRHSVRSDNLLYCQGHDCSFYTFTDEFIPHLKEKVEEYVINNKGKEGVFDGKIYTEGDVKIFLEHLQLYYKYPSDAELYKVFEQQLSYSRSCSSIYSRIFPQDLINKLTGWYEQCSKCRYLTKEYAKTIFSEIRSDKYCETLDHCNVLFKTDLNFNGNHKIFHVVSRQRYFLQALKVFRALYADKKQTLYINPEDDVDVQKQAIEAFEMPSYKFLVIIWPKITDRAVIQQLCNTLSGIIEKRSYKKVILVAEETNELLRELEMSNDVCKIDEDITFDDLSLETQRILLKKRNIILGNNRLSLEEIFGTNNYEELLDAASLEILVKGEGIVRIEKPLRDRDRYYISITFSDHTTHVLSIVINGINRLVRYVEQNHEDEDTVHINISTKKSVEALDLVGRGGELVPAELDDRVADVNIGNDAGNTPLHLAAQNNDLDAVRMLLDHGALVDFENKAGNTALHVASRSGNSDTVKLLLQYGASVNIWNRSGNTPLHLAVRERMLDTAKLLLERTR